MLRRGCVEDFRTNPWRRLDYVRRKTPEGPWSSCVENADFFADRHFVDIGFMNTSRQDVTWKMLEDYKLQHGIYVFSPAMNSYIAKERLQQRTAKAKQRKATRKERI